MKIIVQKKKEAPTIYVLDPFQEKGPKKLQILKQASLF